MGLFQRSLLLSLVVGFAGCGSAGSNCRAIDGWRQGGGGGAAVPGCVNATYREAHELGHSLHGLRKERRELDARIADSPDSAPELRRRQRQLDIDIEAIEGLAVIERWNSSEP